MTRKLYYENAYTNQFSAEILRQDKDQTGLYVILDQTAFYPTGGGQPYDTGTINDVVVSNVEEVDGEIRHYVEAEIESKQVEGQINGERRFDLMQQHLGQHILSAVLEELYDIATVSFHLGASTVTIDVANELTTEMIQAIEKRANEIILDNRSVYTKWITEEEVADYPLRKPPVGHEEIRLVIITDFDYNGCGGTHPRSTGEVMCLKLLKIEKQRKGVRIEFICGHRVLNHFEEKNQILQQMTKLLNSPQEKLESATMKLLQEKKEAEERLEFAEDQLLELEAATLQNNREFQRSIGDKQAVCQIFQDRSIQTVKKLAGKMMYDLGITGLIVLFVIETEDKLQFVMTKSKDVDVDLSQVCKQALPHINGRGGGKDTIQGGGEKTMTADELLELLFSLL